MNDFKGQLEARIVAQRQTDERNRVLLQARSQDRDINTSRISRSRRMLLPHIVGVMRADAAEAARTLMAHNFRPHLSLVRTETVPRRVKTAGIRGALGQTALFNESVTSVIDSGWIVSSRQTTATIKLGSAGYGGYRFETRRNTAGIALATSGQIYSFSHKKVVETFTSDVSSPRTHQISLGSVIDFNAAEAAMIGDDIVKLDSIDPDRDVHEQPLLMEWREQILSISDRK